MLRMFQKAMLGKDNPTIFKDITKQETIVLSILVVLIIFLGIYPKPLSDLITPSLVEIISYIK